MVFVDVIGVNDETPVIASPSVDVSYFGYPTNEGLQEVVGSITTIYVSAYLKYRHIARHFDDIQDYSTKYFS